jgi:hypothetical protein
MEVVASRPSRARAPMAPRRTTPLAEERYGAGAAEALLAGRAGATDGHIRRWSYEAEEERVEGEAKDGADAGSGGDRASGIWIISRLRVSRDFSLTRGYQRVRRWERSCAQVTSEWAKTRKTKRTSASDQT